MFQHDSANCARVEGLSCDQRLHEESRSRRGLVALPPAARERNVRPSRSLCSRRRCGLLQRFMNETTAPTRCDLARRGRQHELNLNSAYCGAFSLCCLSTLPADTSARRSKVKYGDRP